VSSSLRLSNPITIYVDADACPVKQEIYRVAERHARKGIAPEVLVVRNSPKGRCYDDPEANHGVMAGLVPAIHVFRAFRICTKRDVFP
jgi:hypothetical protein